MASVEPQITQQQTSFVPVESAGDRELGLTTSVESTELPIVSAEAGECEESSCCGGGCGSGQKMPRPPVTTETVAGHCESCGKTSQFPPDRDGKIEECPHCREFLDVGELGWEMTDFGQPLD